jgi:hypothetical protein
MTGGWLSAALACETKRSATQRASIAGVVLAAGESRILEERWLYFAPSMVSPASKEE